MNLLYLNDKIGEYPDSWYAATCNFGPECPQLNSSIKADVCVIGAGYTGLSAAVHLVKAGFNVVVLEAQRIGFGASGRNGGQLGSGQRRNQSDLIRMTDQETAKILWEFAEDSKDTVTSLIKEHKIECYLKEGIAQFGFNSKDTRELHYEADFVADRYNYQKIEKLDENQATDICPSPAYHGGVLDKGAFHLHPLRLALGLARAAQKGGAVIYENTEVLEVNEGSKNVVKTARGRVTCEHVVVACNGYIGKLSNTISKHVMPINNFIAATEPLGRLEKKVLTQDIAVADTKFVINYFRKSHDGRLLFGGGENYGYKFPKNIRAKVRGPMLEIFPHLKNIKIEYVWGGTLAITMRRMPFFQKLGQTIYTASGYSGHGVGMAGLAGKLISQAIEGDSRGFDVFAKLPSLPFPGGQYCRYPLLVLAMSWYALRDRFGI